MRAGWLLVLLGALAAGACNGDAPAAAGAALPELDAEELASVPQPALIYRQAYEAAEQEITAETAWQRLREIERAVDRAASARR